MKISATLFLASIGSTSAFVAPASESKSSTLRMSNYREEQLEGKLGGVDLEVRPASGFGAETPGQPGNAPMIDRPVSPVKQRLKSKAIPFMDVSPYLDGSMAGCVGFDPLGFADSQENLTKYREAEIKHARLAMLAAAGWPLSELFNKKLADQFGMETIVDASNRAPNVLNGGMGRVSPVYWIGVVALASIIDLVGLFNVSKKEGYFPGNFGFDPLGLYPKDSEGRKWMETAEIKNGRLAMIAITGFCFQEFVTGVSVVDQSPIFFKPIFEVLANNVPGYYIPEEVVQNAATAAASSVDAVSASSVETISTATVEATSVIPPVVDVMPSAPVDVAAVTPPVVDATPSAPVEVAAVTPSVDATQSSTSEELVAAKKRIVELESKLAAIGNLSR